MTHRPHGSNAKYVVEDCPCEPCRVASRAYANNRARQIAYGRWQPYVDAQAARDHVEKLRQTGLGWQRVAKLAGVTPSVVEKLIYGAAYRGMRPSKRIRAATAAAILSVNPGPAALSGGALVDGTGTRRRLQALVAIGWNQNQLASRLGIDRSSLSDAIRIEKVRARTARAVTELYDELWNTRPPAATHREKISVSRSRNHAKAQGWLLPMAWDDDTIDDPTATAEQPQDAPRSPRAKLPPVDELRWLLDQGETANSIGQRFKVKEQTVQAALSRSAS